MGKSTRYGWYKGYKAHVCSTPEGVVLSYAFTTANVHDSKMAPVLLQDIEDQHVLFSMQTRYDSQHIYKIADMCDIFPVIPLTHEMANKLKVHTVVCYHIL